MSNARDVAGYAAGGAALVALSVFALLSRRMYAPPYPANGPVDPYAPFEPVATCDPVPRPGVRAFASWARRLWGGEDWGIVRDCQPGTATSRHQEGRAWDWHPPTPEAGEAFVRWLLADDPTGEPHGLARRAGVRTVIWNRRIWTAAGPWRPYSGASPHTDHVHLDFSWAGARGETSLYEEHTGGHVAIADDTGAEVITETELTPSHAVELPAVRGLEETSEAFRRKLVAVAVEHGINPAFVAAVISHETAGTFSPSIRNPYSGFVGLIQFGPAAASRLGTSLPRLAQMSATEQLDYVGRYYALAARMSGAPIRTLCDHYLAVFAPAFIGAGPATVLYHKGASYEQNRALDRDGDGAITAGEACAPVLRILDAAASKPPIVVGISPPLADRVAAAVGLASAAAAAVLTWEARS